VGKQRCRAEVRRGAAAIQEGPLKSTWATTYPGEGVSHPMSAHQGGKACLLSTYDAELLVNHGVVPRCIDHRHMRKAAAEKMANKRELRRIRVPGPDRFVEVRPQHWKAVRGVMQLVDGDTPGRLGRLRYSIEATGAHERRQNVRAIKH